MRVAVEMPGQTGDEVADLGDRELDQLAAQVGDPPYLWRAPGQPVSSSGFLRRPARVRVGPQPRSRWSALRTNDLDRGEDRHMLFAADEGGEVRSGRWRLLSRLGGRRA